MIPDELGSRLAGYMDPYTYGQGERVIPRGSGRRVVAQRQRVNYSVIHHRRQRPSHVNLITRGGDNA
ncbi:hypothetical protein Hanom_Chr09g00869991 [Helianthus anomalus]